MLQIPNRVLAWFFRQPYVTKQDIEAILNADDEDRPGLVLSIFDDWDPDQPRDEDGQLAETEGSGTKSESSSPKPAVTPNLSSLPAKHQKRSHEVSNAIAKGRAPLREKDGVNKHLPNNKEYRAHAAEMAAQGKSPPSYFNVDPKELVPTIQEKLRKREASYEVKSNGEVRILIDAGKKVGMTYKGQEKEPYETNIIAVRYSDKYGYHFYPSDI